MRQPFIALLLLAMASLVVSAQWHVDGQPVGDDTSRKVKDGFGAFLVVVPRPDLALERLLAPLPESGNGIPVADRVEPGVKYGALVLLGGCGRDAEGACLTQVDFTVYGPDGMLYCERVGEPAPAQAPSEAHETQVSQAILPLVFEDTDQPGTYRVVAHVRDLTRNLSLDLETSVILEPTQSGRRPN